MFKSCGEIVLNFFCKKPVTNFEFFLELSIYFSSIDAYAFVCCITSLQAIKPPGRQTAVLDSFH